MTGIVSELSLATDTDSDDVEQYLTGALATNLGTIGGKFAAAGGHGHTGATGDAAPIGTAGIANAAITAAKLASGAATGVALGGEVMVRIANVALNASAANIDFTAIPQTYAHLLIAAYLRSDTAATSIDARIQFNGDATAHYHSQRLLGNAAAASAAEAIGGTSGAVGGMPAASDAAVLFSTHLILVPHYTNTVGEKMAIALNFCPTGVTTGTLLTMVQGFVFDNGTSPVSRATLLANAGSLVSGCRVTLYGLPG